MRERLVRYRCVGKRARRLPALADGAFEQALRRHVLAHLGVACAAEYAVAPSRSSPAVNLSAASSHLRPWQRHTLRAEMRRALIAGLPLMAAQVLSIGNGLVDSLVAGRLGPAELAAVGIGSSVVFLVTLSSIGLMAALSPTMARLRGQGRRAEVGVVFRQGLWLALAFGALDLALLRLCLATLGGWGLDAGLVGPMTGYLEAAMWSVPAAVLLLAARNLCEATARTRPVLLVQCAGLLVNLVADLGLGLGWFGLPKLGIAGIGWSTTIVQTSACLILFAMLRAPTFERFAPYRPMERPDPRRLGELLALSAPICLALLAEGGLFGATAIQMGMLGTLEASAHNIAVGTTAVFYMLPLGLSFALTARIGIAFGRESARGARLRATSGILLTLVIASASAAVLALFREPIAALYTDDPAVRTLAARLLLLAAVFQLSDGLQATLLGLLRGLHDTRVPMLINAFSYWGVGFATGWLAAHRWGFGAYGLWFGLIAGLTLAALLQGWRLANRLRRLDARFGGRREAGAPLVAPG